MTTETTTPAAPEVGPAGYSTEQAAEALMSRWESRRNADADPEPKLPRQDDAEPDTTAEQSDEDDAPAEDEGATTPAESDVEYELDFGGSKYKLKPSELPTKFSELQTKVKELEGGATRKFQEAATLRKNAEFTAKLLNQQSEAFADLRSIDREIARIQGLDLATMSDNDPVAVQKETIRLMQLQQARTKVDGHLRQASQELTQAQSDERNAAVEAVREHARSKITGWNEQLDKALGEYVSKVRVKGESLDALVTDPAIYEMAVKAYKYDTLQAAKPADKRAVDAPKSLRPGTAAAPNTSARSAVEAAQARMRKTGSNEDIASLILARARLKGR